MSDSNAKTDYTQDNLITYQKNQEVQKRFTLIGINKLSPEELERIRSDREERPILHNPATIHPSGPININYQTPEGKLVVPYDVKIQKIPERGLRLKRVGNRNPSAPKKIREKIHSTWEVLISYQDGILEYRNGEYQPRKLRVKAQDSIQAKRLLKDLLSDASAKVGEVIKNGETILVMSRGGLCLTLRKSA